MFVAIVFSSHFRKNEKNAFSPDQSFSFQRILVPGYVDFHNPLSLRWRFVGGCILACSTPCDMSETVRSFQKLSKTVKNCHKLSKVMFNAYVQCLCAMPMCNSYVQFLCAMPMCNAYVHCLCALPMCTAYVQCLGALPMFIAYAQCHCAVPILNG